MQTTYKCNNCNTTFKSQTTSFNTTCICGNMAKRDFSNIKLEVEDDTVQAAIETMKYSSLASQKAKVVF